MPRLRIVMRRALLLAAVTAAAVAPDVVHAQGGPAAERLAPTIRGVPISQKVVALTFDDGPSPRYTPTLLRTLKAEGARATFFVIGQEAVRRPDLLKAEAAARMEIGNHGMHHVVLRGKSESEVESEANEAAEAIAGIIGRRPVLYRLPQGLGDTTARAVLGRLGYVIINWSVDTRDYIRQSPEALVARAMRQMAPGRIIIFHDGGGNRQASIDAVKMLLPQLKAQGYTVTTVSDLLRRAGYRRPGVAAASKSAYARVEEQLRRSI